MSERDINRARFLNLAYAASVEAHDRFNIGTYKEKKLHRILKQYFEDDPQYQEVPFAGFIADIKNPDGIIEIQTSGLSSMRDKLEAFLPHCPVTVVFPVAERKWISWIDPDTGTISEKHRSPKKGRALDAVPEMVYILPYLLRPNLTVLVLLLEMEEYRLQDGKRSRDGKRGSHRYERMPTDLMGAYAFHSPADFAAWLPEGLRDPFTAKDLTSALKYRGRAASALIRVLCEVGVIARVGKKGNAYLYRIVKDDAKIFPESIENGDGNRYNNKEAAESAI